MLNPPLSFLPGELFPCIVNHVAQLPERYRNLSNLSLSDRAFTPFCQVHLFRILTLRNTFSRTIPDKLQILKNVLGINRSVANQVRVVELWLAGKRNAWLFRDDTFKSILVLLARSPMPPYKLKAATSTFGPFGLEEPALFVRRLKQSFFSKTLTILHLIGCTNVPLYIILVCPGLKELLLYNVGVSKQDLSKDSGSHLFGKEAPALIRFDYRDAQSLVKEMITPPLHFDSPVVLWSKLRILQLSPHEREELAFLQHILNASSQTLEELHLTKLRACSDTMQIPLTGLVDLSKLPSLRVFAIYAIIHCAVQASSVLADINSVLHTIPASNKITNLWLDVQVSDRHPFTDCLRNDWDGLCSEIIRISSGKPVEFDLQMVVETGLLEIKTPGEDELYLKIQQRIATLSEHPEICIHFWNPTCWSRGLGPLPRGEVRSPCRGR